MLSVWTSHDAMLFCSDGFRADKDVGFDGFGVLNPELESPALLRDQPAVCIGCGL